MRICGERVRLGFPAEEAIISTVKTATFKKGTRSSLFETIGGPLQPILTRWASWLDATFYYTDKIHEIKEMVLNLIDDGIVVEKAKKAVSDPDV